MSKYKKISSLKADEARVYNECKFSHVCKNEGKRYEYDVTRLTIYRDNPKITKIFVWALYRKRNSQGHSTRVSCVEGFSSFISFLKLRGITDPGELNTHVLASYAQWLKNRPTISYTSAAGSYRKLASLFAVMADHPAITQSFIPSKNAFPKSEQAKKPTLGFSEDELKRILCAVTKALRESSKRIERGYERVWMGKPAPIEDVAPFDQSKKGQPDRGSQWLSAEYRLWWWENVAGCQRLCFEDLKKLKGGQGFYLNTQPNQPHWNRKAKSKMESYYDEIGAGENYVPKYLNKESPIKYNSPWQKKEYVFWYWENKLDCLDCCFGDFKEIDNKFFNGVHWNFGSFNNLRLEVNAGFALHTTDLYPYFLMLLIRTGLNPSTIHRLTIDCIVNDPLDPNRKMIDWAKYRSFQKGSTIPIKDKGDTWAVTIIERVIKLTSRIRKEGQKELWITNGTARADNICAIKYPVIMLAAQKFAAKYELEDSEGKPLVLAGSAFRPTLAWIEYLRTEDMNYLQALLGHQRLGTTSDYLRRVKDPVFINRRAIHQEAMFVSLTEEGGKITNIKNEVVSAEDTELGDGLLNHCKDPLASPIEGQKVGEVCSADPDVCFKCQNLVITPEDIKKYFCFMIFYQFLFDIGDITESEFESCTDEKKHYWETYILPKYDSSIVHRIRIEAANNPYPQWDTAKYDGVTNG